MDEDISVYSTQYSQFSDTFKIDYNFIVIRQIQKIQTLLYFLQKLAKFKILRKLCFRELHSSLRNAN